MIYYKNCIFAITNLKFKIMAEMNDSNPNESGLFQKIGDKIKDTSEEVIDKVEDTISDIKNSEFGEKVTDTVQEIGTKAKDIIHDVKESEFMEKVSTVTKDLTSRAKVFGGKVLEKLGTVAGLPSLKNAGEKLRTSPEDTTEKEDQLDELDKIVAVILEDGVITPEEEAMLRQKAESIGIDVDTFLAEVRERCNTEK